MAWHIIPNKTPVGRRKKMKQKVMTWPVTGDRRRTLQDNTIGQDCEKRAGQEQGRPWPRLTPRGDGDIGGHGTTYGCQFTAQIARRCPPLFGVDVRNLEENWFCAYSCYCRQLDLPPTSLGDGSVCGLLPYKELKCVHATSVRLLSCNLWRPLLWSHWLHWWKKVQ